MVFGLTLAMIGNLSGCSFHGSGFYLPFQKFSSFCVQICGLVFGVRFRDYVYGLGLLRFYQA